MGPPRVALVCMPWASPRRPSIALGILKRLCDEAGAPTESFFPNVEIVRHVGLEVTEKFANENSLYGLSEHLFACSLFPRGDLKSDSFLDAVVRVLRGSSTKERMSPVADPALLRELRDSVLPKFLDEVAEQVLSSEPSVVGFTATFNQTMASLALAARLKERSPELIVIAGGACFDGEMGREYQRAFPHLLDHVFLGEAEDAFRAFLGRSEAPPPRSLAVADMNTVPMPDYAPYFEAKSRVEASGMESIDVDFLLFESSRGCWWGEKEQCIFCGINPDLMHFRAKASERVVEEVIELAERHGITRFLATDWILQRNERAELFRRFEEAPIDLDLFYEVRADVDKALLLAMKRAGVNAVQPGIESFSTPLLQVMRKWTSGLRQIQFLRWCREAGIVPHYNLLIGFPGETPAHYGAIADWIPQILHLPPPLENLHRVEIHRFAPLFQEGLPLRADYRMNIPGGRADFSKIGYFYASPPEMYAAEESPEVDRLKSAIDLWLRSHRRAPFPRCEYAVAPDFLEIVDGRLGSERRITVGPLARDVLLLCDRAQSISAMERDLKKKHGGDLRACVDELVEEGLLLREEDHLLTVPTGKVFRTTEELRALVLDASSAKRTLRVLNHR